MSIEENNASKSDEYFKRVADAIREEHAATRAALDRHYERMMSELAASEAKFDAKQTNQLIVRKNEKESDAQVPVEETAGEQVNYGEHTLRFWPYSERTCGRKEVTETVDEWTRRVCGRLQHVYAIDSLILDESGKRELKHLCSLVDNDWHLLYRGTRDGFSADAFHAKCDDKARTVTLVKKTTSDGAVRIFGGYTEATWTQDHSSPHFFKTDANAFLFALSGIDALNGQCSTLVMRCKSKEHAIIGHRAFGPIFGLGRDLEICNGANDIAKCYSVLGVSYDFNVYPTGSAEARRFLAGSEQFTIDEIEVFHIL